MMKSAGAGVAGTVCKGRVGCGGPGFRVRRDLCLLCSPRSSSTSSRGTSTPRAARCTHTSWRASTGCASPGRRAPTLSWPTRWAWARRCRPSSSSTPCTRRCGRASRPGGRGAWGGHTGRGQLVSPHPPASPGPLQGAVPGQCAPVHHHQLGARVRDVGPRLLRGHLHGGQGEPLRDPGE